VRQLFLATLCLGATLAAVGPANASGGCGRGFHRGPAGVCRPNRPVVVAPGPVVVAPRPVVVAPVIGVFYPRRGYWYGGRYWAHRYRWHGGWRYR
jgi:hypothetical protein